MSISGALSNALSGLTAASRGAQVVSSNVSNATNEGYMPRSLELASRVIGGHGGVTVTGMTRHVDLALQSDRRLVDADNANAQTRSSFLEPVSDIAGLPGAPGALGTILAEFDAALVSAASQPNVTTRLDIAVSRAKEVAQALNTMSGDFQQLREKADRTIDTQVMRLNTLLEDLEGMNARISPATGHEKAALLDQRDRMLDEISQIVPIRVASRANDAVALYTPKGAILLEGQAAEIGFAPTPTIMPHMTAAAGLLSGLTINGNPVSVDPAGGSLGGGSLGALFDMRDRTLVRAQAGLDAVARDLAERFQVTSLDPTLSSGDAGLFTDAGASVVPVNETGLAGRLSVHAAVDPDSGGATWRMRDGLAAVTQGSTGDGRLLTAMSAALGATQKPESPALPAVGRSLHGLVADLQSNAASDLNEQHRRNAFVTAQRDALLTLEREGGVDTDAEMQNLMRLEQSYAANARVIETVGKLIDTLMRI
ncbi:flagellar hook-associated protein FlgK [Lutimaribacter sp. EGI FJ00015]|uniref:Flagellar hook-associated protein FlgK n=1 Tax=Lutimaribacter degradans TaxID=2945989 RepID=A0ACC5ZVD4_9RHOB|nr:flagellar hook-associated protein FlgK [Lutimaribacter sp. EGI FJ00013]MCM2561918.1 flagellar hook-associated protein FlgK [Lutimaribacter sp. EGI FJ00013]MCO0613050.1 flagellar hook-associated protein FlgK [Lutimaribacter sp. EGI FJ00015]MCO0635750.1 flagellar hook-associated protein FlgK [Lutimaribacter sp. EGI FJ00014]